jgi:hypothetical protein
MDAAMGERRAELVGFVQAEWDKYRSPMSELAQQREDISAYLGDALRRIGYGD